MTKNALIFILLLAATTASAHDNRTLDRTESADPQSLFTLDFANDVIYDTNKSFSNRFRFIFTTPFMEHSPVNFMLIPNNRGDSVFYSLTVQHDIYSPEEKFDIATQFTQTPYAAFLMIGSKKEAFNKTKKYKLTSQLQLGVLGPLAFGEEISNGIHRIFPEAVQARGWENQIGTDFCIMYTAGIEKNIVDAGWFNLDVISAGALGNPFTRLDGGVAMRTGLFADYFENFGFSNSKHWQVFLYGNVRARFVGYDATLQGGLFSDNSIYTRDDVRRALGRFVAGLSIIHGNIKIELENHFTTPGFEAGDSHKWGNLNIQFRY